MTWLDNLLDFFFLYRLGSAAEDETKCLYYRHNNINMEKSTEPEIMNRFALPLIEKTSDGKRIVRIVVISDTHERHDKIGKLPIADVLIHCGDIFMTNRLFSKSASTQKLLAFNDWLLSSNVPIREKIIVAGNHDYIIEQLGMESTQRMLSSAVYIENSYHILECGLKIWGSPLSNGKSGNKAFQSHTFHQATKESFERLVISQSDTDLIITHGPNFHIVSGLSKSNTIHLWGHAHGYYGVRKQGTKLWGQVLPFVSINASIMNTSYEPHSYPIVIDMVVEE